MASFVLIPGAGGVAWYWHRVVPLLQAAGHDAIAVDLPGDDDRAGLPEYAAITRGVARERLGADVIAIPGGHLVALSNPNGVAEQLVATVAS